MQIPQKYSSSNSLNFHLSLYWIIINRVATKEDELKLLKRQVSKLSHKYDFVCVWYGAVSLCSFPSHSAFIDIFRQKRRVLMTHAEAQNVCVCVCMRDRERESRRRKMQRGLLVERRRERRSISTTLAMTLLPIQLLFSMNEKWHKQKNWTNKNTSFFTLLTLQKHFWQFHLFRSPVFSVSKLHSFLFWAYCAEPSMQKRD